MTQLDSVKLKQQAAQEAGLAEFGEDAYAEFYDRFVAALNTEGARLTERGVQRASANIGRALRNRLVAARLAGARTGDWGSSDRPPDPADGAAAFWHHFHAPSV